MKTITKVKEFVEDIKYQVVPNDNGDYSSALLIYKEDK